MKKIFVSTPCTGYDVSGAYHATMALLQTLARDREWSLYEIPHFGTSDLINTRNIDVHNALCTDATHFLTFDSDQGTDEKTLLGLLDSPWPLTAAPVRKKNDHLPLAESWNFLTLPDPQVLRGDYLKVLVAGSGAMCVWREVLEDMCYSNRFYMREGAPIPELYARTFTEQDPLFPEQVSEDFGFCLRAFRAGYEPWLYVPGKVRHIGAKTFVGELTL